MHVDRESLLRLVKTVNAVSEEANLYFADEKINMVAYNESKTAYCKTGIFVEPDMEGEYAVNTTTLEKVLKSIRSDTLELKISDGRILLNSERDSFRIQLLEYQGLRPLGDIALNTRFRTDMSQLQQALKTISDHGIEYTRFYLDNEALLLTADGDSLGYSTTLKPEYINFGGNVKTAFATKLILPQVKHLTTHGYDTEILIDHKKPVEFRATLNNQDVRYVVAPYIDMDI